MTQTFLLKWHFIPQWEFHYISPGEFKTFCTHKFDKGYSGKRRFLKSFIGNTKRRSRGAARAAKSLRWRV